MVTQYKQIRIHKTTSNRLDKRKVIPKEPYDSVINRTITEAEQNGTNSK